MSALISTDPSPAGNDEVREIEIDLIRPGHEQPRTTFDQAKLEELAQSIRTTGVIQPLLTYRLIERTVDLIDKLISLASNPLMRPVRKRALGLVKELREFA